MKKLLITLTALSTLAMATPALANSKLPFVGKRVFTFEYDKDKEIITIAKNGQTKIVTSKTHWLGLGRTKSCIKANISPNYTSTTQK